MKKIIFTAVFLSLFFVFVPAFAADIEVWDLGAPVPSADREWTILVYMDGDNDLERFALADMKELEKGMTPDSKVDVVVLFDRAKGYDTSMGDWTETRVYHVKPHARNDDLDSEMLADCGELNMGDPETLEAFIRAGVAKYPAPRVALFMWNHGGGWIVMASDEDAPGAENGVDALTLAEFRGALERTAPLLPDGKFDLVFFDMCLMGQAEVVAACAPFAKYMVAGAPVVPGVGMDYTKALPLFRPGAATGEIAAGMVKVGCAGFLDASCEISSLTAFDLSKADAFLEAFKVMAAKLAEGIPDTWGDVTRTLFFAQSYAGRSDYERGQGSLSSIDLLDWLARVKKTVKNPPLKEIASLEAAANMLMMATEKGSKIPFCNGLSFYAPLRGANLRPDYADTDFNKKTGWLGALAKLHEAQAKDGMDPPKVVSIEFGTPANLMELSQSGKPISGADLKITPSDSAIPLSGKDEGGSWIKIIFEGKNILWGYAGFGMSDSADPGGEYTMFLHTILMDENLDLEAAAKKREEAADFSDALTPVFKDGRTELAYMFGGATHRFSNGEKSVLVTADFLNVSDMNHFVVKGAYSDQQTGTVAVEVSVNTDFYAIESITGIAENGTVFAVSPSPEGVFRPLLNKRNASGNTRLVLGEEILWKDGLYVIFEPIPEGRFAKIVAMAESIGGSGGQLISRPIAVKANPYIAAHIDATHREGWDRLLGRYAVMSAVPRSDNGAFIMAPVGSFVHIKTGTLPNGREGLIAVQRILEEVELTTYVRWQMEGLPFVSRYLRDEETGELLLMERDFALLVLDGGSYFWRMNDAEHYTPFLLVPLDNPMLSREILKGTWDGEDGSSLVFDNGQGSYYPPEAGRRGVSGSYAATDNAAVISPAGQQPFTLYFAFNGQNVMAATFKDTQTAMIYNRRQTTTTTTTTPPTQTGLDGVWGAMVGGQQWVMQIQFNPYQQAYQYQGWVNGMPAEAGMFQIQGNTMYGQTTAGMTYTNYFQWDPNGTAYSITMQNGFTIVYQRMQ